MSPSLAPTDTRGSGIGARLQLIRGARWAFPAIMALALALRLWGLGFGLPYLYHPDEPFNVRVVQNMVKTGDLNPHFFTYPTLFYYIQALAYGAYSLVGAVRSPADTPSFVQLGFGTGMTPLPGAWLLGRAVSTALGTASVGLVYLIGRRLADRRAVGLAAALWMAVSPMNVSNSRLITPDMLLVFTILLALLAIVQVYRRGYPRDYALAGAACGLAVAAKYNGALAISALLLAHFLAPGRAGLRDRRLYLALLLAAAAFTLSSPYVLLDFRSALDGLRYNANHYTSGHPGMEGHALSYYLATLWQVEGPASALGALGILRGLCRRSRAVALLAVFPAVYFPFISSLAVRNPRTLMPVTPFLFLLAALLFVELLAQANRQAWLTVAIAALGFLSLALPLRQTVLNAIQLTTVDSRETARVWLAENLPAGARVCIEGYAPYLDPQRFSLQVVLRMIDHPAEWYVANGCQYLVFSQGMYKRYFREPTRYAQQVAAYEALFRAFEPLKVFQDGGYEIRIYCVHCHGSQ